MVNGDFVRLATVEDADRITEIYNQGIEDRIATFETEARVVSTIRAWFNAPYPIVVVERAGEVIAWANASQYRPRACYAGICEFSVYVDRSARGSGAGREAMEGLIHAAANLGYTKLVSRVFVENSASRGLLGRLGFREVGIYERHGQLDGAWRDVVIVEKLLERSNDPWIGMSGGQIITIAKTHWGQPDPVLTYRGTLLPFDRDDWMAFEALWTSPDVDVEGVLFLQGGKILEYFSKSRRYNVFQVFAPDGTFTGIYANITAPATLSLDIVGQPVLTWEDHWLDVVMLPDGSLNVLDEDEYAESGVPESHPELHAQILQALDELMAELRAGIWTP